MSQSRWSDADEVVDRGHLVELESDAQLQGIQGANLPGKSVSHNEILGAVVMDVEQTEDLISPACHVRREEAPKPGEFGGVELPGADLDGEDGDRLDQGQASDEQLNARRRR